MHIAMVVRQFSPNGGLELYALQIVKGLLDRGHRVTVICESDDTGFSHANLAVRKFPASPAKASKATKNEHYYQAASAAVREFGPFDVVHSQHLPVANADAVTFHNHTVYRLSEVGQSWERMLNQFKISTKNYQSRDKHDRLLCHHTQCLIFPAQVCVDDFARHYPIGDKKIARVHPAANLNEERTASAGMLAKDSTFNFLFVGKGYRKKGLDILLSACALLRKKDPQFKLLIAGLREKPLGKLQLMLLGLQNHVQYLGFQKDMNAVYKRAQATILPSRIEPFGMAPIQGMLHGLVPIVSQVCGVAEVLSDGSDSLILKNHLSADELSEHMLALMTMARQDASKFAEFGSKARQTAEKLTWDATVEQTLAAYSTLGQNKTL
jgi:glycosyltransferase involved in cell wall biosynthesis